MPARALFLIAFLASAGVARAAPWRWDLPAGTAPPAVPADNAMSAAKVALGRRLFYDGRISVGGTMSCATCHQQHLAFASANATEPGIGGDPGRRNVPGLANVAWLTPLTWHDPGIRTLETQMSTPLFGVRPVEMAARPGEVIAMLRADACYPRLFKAAYPAEGGRIDVTTLAKAIASFQRTMISYRSPFDAFRRGDSRALSPVARRGAVTFARECAACHSGANLSDGQFHAVLPVDPEAEDRGLMEVTGRVQDDGRFRTAPLRNVALTAPYFHDGSTATLPAAIRRHPGAARLDEPAVGELVAFLDALTDQAFVTNPALSPPGRSCEIAPLTRPAMR